MNRPPAMNEGPPSISSSRSYSSRDRMTLLPEDFTPSDDDVICGRGKKCYAHIGNDRFRKRVTGMLGEYQKARSKLDKSKVLSDVVEQVRLNSPRGGFVKQDSDGRWYEVGDFLAREKTSQAFRDALHENYKSSNVAKKKRRQQDPTRSDKFIKLHSDGDIARRMEKLTFDQSRRESHHSRGFMRAPRELRLDHDRSPRSSYSSGGGSRSPPPRLSSGNVSAVAAAASSSSDFNIAELRNMERRTDVDQFYFRDHDRDMDAQHNEVMSAMHRSRQQQHRRTTHYNPRQTSYSLPSSPMNVPPVYEDTMMMEDLHHSVPNMHISFDNRKQPPINEMEAMHHSLPNMYFDADPSDSSDMEPIPLNLALPDLATKKMSTSSATRPAAMSSRLVERTKEEQPDQHQQQHHRHQHQPRGKAGEDQPITISSTLIESLAKITESSGTDDNPFEPIPLSPAAKKRPPVTMSQSDFPNIDDSEQPLDDAFEEED